MCGYQFVLTELHPDRWDPKVDPHGDAFIVNRYYGYKAEQARVEATNVSKANPNTKYMLTDEDCGGPCSFQEVYKAGVLEPEWPSPKSSFLSPGRRKALVTVEQWKQAREIIRMTAEGHDTQHEAKVFTLQLDAEKLGLTALPTEEHRDLLKKVGVLEERQKDFLKLLEILSTVDQELFKEEIAEHLERWQKFLLDVDN